MAVDLTSIAIMGAAALLLQPPAVGWRQQALVVALGALLGGNFLHLLGAHSFPRFARLGEAVSRVVAGMAAATATMAAATVLVEPVTGSKGPWLFSWFAASAVAICAIRLALHHRMKIWSRAGRLAEVAAIVGAGPLGQSLVRRLRASPHGPRVLGVYDDEVGGLPRRCMGLPILGRVDDLVDHVRSHGIDLVIVALPASAEHRIVDTLRKLSLVPVDVRLCPTEFAMRLGALPASHLAGVTLLNVIDRPLKDWRRVAKAVEDRLLAALILLLIAPVLLAIALAVRLDSPGPVLFRQKRYGFNNQLIEVLKFRTMYHELSDERAERLTQRDDPRVTRLGAFLRRTSLDELPQFLNVLRGEMSIVGPRPHALAAKAGPLLYGEAVKHYDARHRMKPGITGWAQVNGWRGETDTPEQLRKRVEHDLYYIENWSIGLDLRIILRTILGGFTGRNAF